MKEKTKKNTPGPWRVVGNGIYGDWNLSEMAARGFYDRPASEGLSAVKIADMTPRRFSYQPDDNDANARLIAAAPELLGALQEIVLTTALTCPSVRGRARAAIAKATSEENSGELFENSPGAK